MLGWRKHKLESRLPGKQKTKKKKNKKRLLGEISITSDMPMTPPLWQKLKKVGKTTRPFRYDLNRIPYDYTVEMRDKFKGLDLIERVPDIGYYRVLNRDPCSIQ